MKTEVPYKEEFLLSFEHTESYLNNLSHLKLDVEMIENLDMFSYSQISEKYKNSLALRPISNITILGAGGVTSWLLPQLIKILYNYKVKNNITEDIIIKLVDNDEISTRNLLRQNFIPEDVGKNKAQVLSDRYNEIYEGIKVVYIPKYFYFDIFLERFEVDLGVTEEDFENKYINLSQIFGYCDILINCVDNEVSKHMLDYYIKFRHSLSLMYFSSGCDMYNGNIFSSNFKDYQYSEYFKDNTFIEEDARIDTPECAVLAEQASAEQTFDSNNMAANLLAVLLNNYISDPTNYETLRTNFVCTRSPRVEVVDYNVRYKVYKFLSVFKRDVYILKDYLRSRDYEFKSSKLGKDHKKIFDFYAKFTTPELLLQHIIDN